MNGVRAAGAAGVAGGTPPTYQLLRSAPPPVAPFVPDAEQRRVLEHRHGPLLVLAGPGTGKTSTLVELVARRVEDGLRPDQVLTLTFSRKAAEELRARIATRLAMPLGVPVAWTFHSWCYAWVRERQEPAGAPAGSPAGSAAASLRLLSGAEQDVMVRELLRGSTDATGLGGIQWPALLRACLGTAGLAHEVRAVLGRLAELGMSGGDLAEIGRRAGRPEWQALGAFGDDYLDVLDARGVLDYGELLRRAVLLAEQPAGQALLRSRYALVVVDEFQDTDPLQERLLRALAGDGRPLVAVGDPDQAVYAFRGADVRGLLDFPGRFPAADGREASTVALRTSRRCGPAILAAAGRISGRIPAPGLDPTALSDHRHPIAVGPASATVAVTLHDSANAEAQAIAAELRRQHLRAGTPWHEMAVLVRSATRSLPLLRRVLTAAGVPVASSAEEVPLAQEPALTPLLLALRCAADPDTITAEVVGTLLAGPLVGADPAILRRLARHLRGAEGSVQPPSSSEALRAAVLDPSLVAGMPDGVAWPVVRLAGLLAAARAADGPEAALWELWSGGAAAGRLQADSDRGGAAGRAADRDLDAVVALFGYVARSGETRRGGAGVGVGVGSLLDEIEAQQIPADPGRVSGPRESGVRLMTAHRSKGLEWDVVVLAGLQEGLWPDLRRRASLLEPDRIDWPDAEGATPAGATVAELLADERRLFFVALTRARQRLLVTAVSAADEDGPRPSRFLAELGLPVTRADDDGASALTLDSVVARLRALACEHPSEPVRAAAVERLARLAVTTDSAGELVVASADPRAWWGARRVTVSERPVRDPQRPLALSGSSLTNLDRCPLQWFLEHEVHAERSRSAASGFGSVIHALAKEVVDGVTAPDLLALADRLDTVWGQLSYEAGWQAAQERESALAALARFLVWHQAARGREIRGAEVDYRVEVSVPRPVPALPGDAREEASAAGPASVTVALSGSFDRVEIDADGAAWIVDLKTEKRPKTANELAEHPQLGTYQLAVRAGALDELFGQRPPVAGAELVQLRQDGGPASAPAAAGGAGLEAGRAGLEAGGADLEAGGAAPGTACAGGSPKVQRQPPLGDDTPTWIETVLGAAADRVLLEQFPPQVGKACDLCAYRASCPAQAEGAQVIR